MKSVVEIWKDAIVWAVKHLEKNHWSVKNIQICRFRQCKVALRLMIF